MISRRSLFVGGACAVAAGAAYALKPRHNVSLLGDRKLDDIVPRSFGAWTSQDVGGLVAPKIEGSLADRLYSQTLERIYQNGETGDEVMMLMAHGDRNTDELQLHRPESCYPAFGFTLTSNKPTELGLGERVTVPARRLVAEAPGRLESIIYWSRLGEFLPIDSGQQREDRLKTAMAGYIPDGLLARFSAVGDEPESVFQILTAFVPSLVMATAPKERDALVGTARASALASQA